MLGDTINFKCCSIIHNPYTFIDKKGTTILICPLGIKQHESLIYFYFNHIPRNSFNGLPPIKDATCLTWIKHTIANAFNLVAVSFEQRIIGHACLFPVSSLKGEMFIVVTPDCRNRGIGTQLVQCIIQLAFEAGLGTLWLMVHPANRIARHIYKKCGFQYLSISQIDEVDMVLDLSRCRHG